MLTLYFFFLQSTRTTRAPASQHHVTVTAQPGGAGTRQTGKSYFASTQQQILLSVTRIIPVTEKLTSFFLQNEVLP